MSLGQSPPSIETSESTRKSVRASRRLVRAAHGHTNAGVRKGAHPTGSHENCQTSIANVAPLLSVF